VITSIKTNKLTAKCVVAVVYNGERVGGWESGSVWDMGYMGL